MKTFKFHILAFLISLFALSSFADNIKIFGVVKDNEEKPIEFGTVRIPGTTIGTNTELQGKYSLLTSSLF